MLPTFRVCAVIEPVNEGEAERTTEPVPVEVEVPVPPRATGRVPTATAVAFTNKPVELAIMPELARTDKVPVEVIGPPVRPEPEATEVTVPVVSVDQ